MTHTRFLFLALAAVYARAQKSPLNPNPSDTNNPTLVGKRFPFNQLPYQADTTTSERGSQYGYNICNSTTEGQNSLCQTALINGIDDFCLWSSPTPNLPIGNSESYEVAWCTKPTHGARLIPQGALTAVQFIKTPSYVQVTGRLNQAMLNLPADDFGGELDSGGQDGRGNPIGGLVYSSNLPGGTAQLPVQAASWHNFIGGDVFCFKACDPNAAEAVGLCQHIYDRIGCTYNAPAAYTPDVFLSCLGDDQDPVGVYTSNGQVVTYHQPAESLGAITSVPYQPRVPATSQCTTFTSAQLYSGLPSVSVSSTASSSTPTGSTSGSSTKSGSGSSTAGSGTTTSGAPSSTQSGAALSGRELSGLLSGAAALVALANMA